MSLLNILPSQKKVTATTAATLTALGLSSVSLHAASVDITSYDNGWYSSAGLHSESNTNITNMNNAPYELYRNFFTFDLSGISFTSITSATLTIDGGNGGYGSTSASVDISFFDVSTDIASLTSSSTTDSYIYDDLGSGSLYGSATITTQTDPATTQRYYRGTMPDVIASLSQDALSDLNGLLGGTDTLFAIGGASAAHLGGLWSGSGGTGAATLTLVGTVPLPAPGLLLLGGIGGLAALRSFRRKAA